MLSLFSTYFPTFVHFLLRAGGSPFCTLSREQSHSTREYLPPYSNWTKQINKDFIISPTLTSLRVQHVSRCENTLTSSFKICCKVRFAKRSKNASANFLFLTTFSVFLFSSSGMALALPRSFPHLIQKRLFILPNSGDRILEQILVALVFISPPDSGGFTK